MANGSRTSGIRAATRQADATAHWSALMARGRAGDQRAYDALLVDVGAWLGGYFRRRLPHAHVDDAVQETLLALHHRRHDFDCSQPLRPWLAAIARFKWVDRLRAMERERTAPAMDTSCASHEIDVVSCHAVRGLLGQLRPAQAEAIRMVKIDGLSIVEASALSGQSQSLVKINIHRGLKRLAGQLEADAGRAETSLQA
ncbi:sigma factor [Sandarakinorhabdus rubra]|uniref:sigma factor n=1 Tax=Sandarakinorhabdus rubra TaxID=2672568 RepID=UPI001F35095C|nr:sigma factor-like helix-turn-helix DNA-binding protein [Sandarakinorhabdus rubra]